MTNEQSTLIGIAREWPKVLPFESPKCVETRLQLGSTADPDGKAGWILGRERSGE